MAFGPMRPWSRMRRNSEKPELKTFSMPRVERWVVSILSCMAVRSVPDQNFSSKVSASFSASTSTWRLRKMIIHEATEATSSRSITPFTSQPACMMSCQTCESLSIF